MDLGRIRLGLGSKRPQRLEPACDVFKGYALQFGAALQSLYEKRQRRFYGFTALREPIEIASTVEITKTGHPRSVRMRLQITPSGELGQRGIDFFNLRELGWPSSFGKHFVGSKLQPVLPLGCGENVHDAAIKVGLFGADVPEKFGRIAYGLHRQSSRYSDGDPQLAR